MAAVIDFRVESNGPDQVTLRWLDNGGTTNDIYRSTDGVNFSLIATVALGIMEFVDQTVLFDTLYFYRISNDGGATFTAVEGAFTHPLDKSGGQAVVPSYTRQDETLLHQLSQAPQYTDIPGEFDRCIVCPVSGRLVLDCRLGCIMFEVEAEEDINSIAILGCTGCPTLVVNVPANTTIGICGWPVGCGMPGDECFQAPIEGGNNGRRAPTSGVSVVDERAGGGPGSGDCSGGSGYRVVAECPGMAGAPCFETGGEYTTNQAPNLPTELWCFWDADVCLSNITVFACGGTPPYTWNLASFGDPGACAFSCSTVNVSDENSQVGCGLQNNDGVKTTYSCTGTCQCDPGTSHVRGWGVCTDDAGLIITFNLQEGI